MESVLAIVYEYVKLSFLVLDGLYYLVDTFEG